MHFSIPRNLQILSKWCRLQLVIEAQHSSHKSLTVAESIHGEVFWYLELVNNSPAASEAHGSKPAVCQSQACWQSTLQLSIGITFLQCFSDPIWRSWELNVPCDMLANGMREPVASCMSALCYFGSWPHCVWSAHMTKSPALLLTCKVQTEWTMQKPSLGLWSGNIKALVWKQMKWGWDLTKTGREIQQEQFSFILGTYILSLLKLCEQLRHTAPTISHCTEADKV